MRTSREKYVSILEGLLIETEDPNEFLPKFVQKVMECKDNEAFCEMGSLMAISERLLLEKISNKRDADVLRKGTDEEAKV